MRNREDQYYSDRNATVVAGVLRLEARQESVPNAQWKAGSGDWRLKRQASRYTSASLVSRRPLQYGRIEVVARTPGGAGMWPAIWLLQEREGVYGEIDLFEAVGKHPDTVFAGVHYGRTPRTRRHRNDSRVVPGFEGSWHTHTLEWTPDAIRVALDGQPWFDFDATTLTLSTNAAILEALLYKARGTQYVPGGQPPGFFQVQAGDVFKRAGHCWPGERTGCVAGGARAG